MAEEIKKSKLKSLSDLFRRKKKPKSESPLGSEAIIPTSRAKPSAPLILHSPAPKLENETVSGAKNLGEPTRIDRVPLPPLLKHSSTNPAILKAQGELQRSIEELQAELTIYTDKHSEYAPLKNEDLISAVSASEEGNAGFRRVIEQVLSDKEAGSKTVVGKVGAFMGQVYPIAGVVLGIVSFGADAAGFLPLKVTANGVNAVVTKAASQHTRSEDVLTSLPDLKKHDSFFSSLQQLGYDRISDGLLEAATELFVAITNFLRACLKFLDTNIVVDALKTIVKDNLADAKAALVAAIANLDAAVNQEVLFDEKNKSWRQECEKAMDFLSDLPFLKAHDDVKNRRMKDSGKWILKKEIFRKWIDGDLKTVWCPGKPGAGKTLLCSTIIDYCRSVYRPNSTKQQAVGFAWIYCKYSDQDMQTMDRIMASIIKQLVATACRDKEEALMKDVTKFGQDHKGGSPSLDDYLELLSNVVSSLDRCVIVIDALDECAEKDTKGYNRKWLITTLLGLKVQLLVTSRDLPAIEGLFKGDPNLGKIPISPDAQDIESYIRWRVFDEQLGSPNLKRVIEEQPSLMAEITKVVTKKYSEIFNLARLQMDEISMLTSIGRVRAALETLPVMEEVFYNQSVKRIKAKKTHEQALRILAWTLRAKRPMEVREMQYAAAIVPGNYSMEFKDFLPGEGDIIDCCEGLVVILPKSGTVAFAHPTVQDYLKSTVDHTFALDPQVLIASTCLTYLASDNLCNNSVDFIDPLALHDYPFVSYAALTWAESSRGEVEKEVLDLIIELFKRNIGMAVFRPLYGFGNWKGFDHRLKLHKDGIWIASSEGLEQTVRRLLRMGAVWKDFEYKDPTSSKRSDRGSSTLPLLRAVSGGYSTIAQVLLEAGAKANGTDRWGETGLHYAAMEEQFSISRQLIEILLSWGADIEARDPNGQTPLHRASQHCREKGVEFLLDNRADIETKDKAGNTPLHIASQEPDNSRAVSILLSRGAPMDSRNKAGRTALHAAAVNRAVENMQLLFEKGVELEAEDNKGQTALHLIANGREGGRDLEAAQYLLKVGANLEARSKLGRTPLLDASYHGRDQVVKLFLEHGADVDVKDEKGQRAIDIAQERQAKGRNIPKFEEVIVLLEQAAAEKVAAKEAGT